MTLLWTMFSCTCNDARTFVSLFDPRYPEPPVFEDGPLVLHVATDADDGTLSGARFLPDGADGTNQASGDERIVLRFPAPAAGNAPPLHAVLQLPVLPTDGTGPVELRIRGLGPGDRPTAAEVGWTLPAPWPDPYAGMPAPERRAPPWCAPFDRETPDLTPIVSELAAAGLPPAFVIEAVAGALEIHDTRDVTDAECEGRLSPRLELSPTLRSTFVARELLGQPTDTSIAVTVMSRVDLELAVDVIGVREGTPRLWPANTPISVIVDGLLPATAHRLQTRYRRPGTDGFERGPERAFHTARRPGEAFSFTVTADVHYLNMANRRGFAGMHLLRRTMTAIAAARPDFHIDLGDSLNGESYRSYDAPDDEEARRRVLDVRPYFEAIGAPLLLVLGNHEGEQGWRRDGLPERAARARQALVPNPAPGAFVTSADRVGGTWAFTWGDVLVVALDPYRNTMRKPHDLDGAPAEGDRWDWTLGQAQYDWLVRTLEGSDATYKLVFAHQITGGTNAYGRGGRMGAERWEWGGQDALAEHRPGWPRAIHRVLADNRVTAFVHGHDHVFAFEPPLDGVGYVTAPQPGDVGYDAGHGRRSGIAPGSTVIENSGWLRFARRPDGLEMTYVRSFLPGDGEEQIAFSHVFPPRGPQPSAGGNTNAAAPATSRDGSR